MADDLASTLAEIRERRAKAVAYFDGLGLPEIVPGLDYLRESAGDIPRLLTALEAVLKQAGEWSETSAGLEGGHRGLADHGADSLRTAMYARSVALKDCEQALRAAITTALTGVQLGEDDKP